MCTRQPEVLAVPAVLGPGEPWGAQDAACMTSTAGLPSLPFMTHAGSRPRSAGGILVCSDLQPQGMPSPSLALVLCMHRRPDSTFQAPTDCLGKPPPCLPSTLKFSLSAAVRGRIKRTSRRHRPLWQGPRLTVPLRARCVGHSSGDVLISPELPA